MTKKDVGGRPRKYDSPNTRTTFSITVEGLDRVADALDLSRSQLVELIGRGDFLVTRRDEAKRQGLELETTNCG